MQAYTETYASLAKSLVDDVVHSPDPSSERAIGILSMLERESSSRRRPVTPSILQSTNIERALAKTVRAGKKYKSAGVEDAKGKADWDTVIKSAEALISTFNDVTDATNGRKSTSPRRKNAGKGAASGLAVAGSEPAGRHVKRVQRGDRARTSLASKMKMPTRGILDSDAGIRGSRRRTASNKTATKSATVNKVRSAARDRNRKLGEVRARDNDGREPSRAARAAARDRNRKLGEISPRVHGGREAKRKPQLLKVNSRPDENTTKNDCVSKEVRVWESDYDGIECSDEQNKKIEYPGKLSDENDDQTGSRKQWSEEAGSGEDIDTNVEIKIDGELVFGSSADGEGEDVSKDDQIDAGCKSNGNTEICGELGELKAGSKLDIGMKECGGKDVSFVASEQNFVVDPGDKGEKEKGINELGHRNSQDYINIASEMEPIRKEGNEVANSNGFGKIDSGNIRSVDIGACSNQIREVEAGDNKICRVEIDSNSKWEEAGDNNEIESPNRGIAETGEAKQKEKCSVCAEDDKMGAGGKEIEKIEARDKEIVVIDNSGIEPDAEVDAIKAGSEVNGEMETNSQACGRIGPGCNEDCQLATYSINGELGAGSEKSHESNKISAVCKKGETDEKIETCGNEFRVINYSCKKDYEIKPNGNKVDMFDNEIRSKVIGDDEVRSKGDGKVDCGNKNDGQIETNDKVSDIVEAADVTVCEKASNKKIDYIESSRKDETNDTREKDASQVEGIEATGESICTDIDRKVHCATDSKNDWKIESDRKRESEVDADGDGFVSIEVGDGNCDIKARDIKASNIDSCGKVNDKTDAKKNAGTETACKAAGKTELGPKVVSAVETGCKGDTAVNIIWKDDDKGKIDHKEDGKIGLNSKDEAELDINKDHKIGVWSEEVGIIQTKITNAGEIMNTGALGKDREIEVSKIEADRDIREIDADESRINGDRFSFNGAAMSNGQNTANKGEPLEYEVKKSLEKKGAISCATDQEQTSWEQSSGVGRSKENAEIGSTNEADVKDMHEVKANFNNDGATPKECRKFEPGVSSAREIAADAKIYGEIGALGRKDGELDPPSKDEGAKTNKIKIGGNIEGIEDIIREVDAKVAGGQNVIETDPIVIEGEHLEWEMKKSPGKKNTIKGATRREQKPWGEISCFGRPKRKRQPTNRFDSLNFEKKTRKRNKTRSSGTGVTEIIAESNENCAKPNHKRGSFENPIVLDHIDPMKDQDKSQTPVPATKVGKYREVDAERQGGKKPESEELMESQTWTCNRYGLQNTKKKRGPSCRGWKGGKKTDKRSTGIVGGRKKRAFSTKGTVASDGSVCEDGVKVTHAPKLMFDASPENGEFQANLFPKRNTQKVDNNTASLEPKTKRTNEDMVMSKGVDAKMCDKYARRTEKGKGMKLTEDRIVALDGIGFKRTAKTRGRLSPVYRDEGPEPDGAGDDTKPEVQSFADRIEELKRFREKHGHLRITRKDDRSLSEFVVNIRRARRSPNDSSIELTEERISLLDEISFEWDGSKRPGRKGKKVRKPFDERLSDIKKYREKHGHIRVSRKEDQSLYDFLMNVKYSLNHPQKGILKLTEERIASLDTLGIRKAGSVAGYKHTPASPLASNDSINSERDEKQNNQTKRKKGQGGSSDDSNPKEVKPPRDQSDDEKESQRSKTKRTNEDMIISKGVDAKMCDEASTATLTTASTDGSDSVTRKCKERGSQGEVICQAVEHKKVGFSEETLPPSLFKPHHRVYAKDDATGLLYQAMVRKVMWGPKSNRVSLGSVSSLADGTPFDIGNIDNDDGKVQANDSNEDEQDEDARRWNPKSNCWHYFVHYMGWAVKWDRWVEEPLLYEDSASTNDLAKTLMKEYNQVKPKKKGQKMSINQVNKWMKRIVAIEAEHRGLASGECGDSKHDVKSSKDRVDSIQTKKKILKNDGDSPSKPQKQAAQRKRVGECDARSLSEETLQKMAQLRAGGLQVKRKKSLSDRLLIPFNLKKVLVDEWEIIQCGMVHNLPANVTVRDALEQYLEGKLAPLRKKSENQTCNSGANMQPVSEPNQEKGWRDMVEGIALFFDQALPVHLLFAEERSQYQSLRRQILAQRRNSAARDGLKGSKSNEAEEEESKAEKHKSPQPAVPTAKSANLTGTAQPTSNDIDGTTTSEVSAASLKSCNSAKSPPPKVLSERPSEIYGCEHLLRLLVRLPGVAAEHASVSETRSRQIFSKLGDLVRYLQKHQSQLFCSSFKKPLPGEIRRPAKKISGKALSASSRKNNSAGSPI